MIGQEQQLANQPKDQVPEGVALTRVASSYTRHARGILYVLANKLLIILDGLNNDDLVNKKYDSGDVTDDKYDDNGKKDCNLDTLIILLEKEKVYMIYKKHLNYKTNPFL